MLWVVPNPCHVILPHETESAPDRAKYLSYKIVQQNILCPYPIALAGHTFLHIRQPAQSCSLILTVSPDFSKPGQPSFKQILHFVHFSDTVSGGPNGFFKCKGHGASETINHGSGDPVASFNVATAVLMSRGSSVRTFLMPQALPISAMEAATVGSPISVIPEPGLSWCPVIAVMRLSQTMMVELPLL